MVNDEFGQNLNNLFLKNGSVDKLSMGAFILNKICSFSEEEFQTSQKLNKFLFSLDESTFKELLYYFVVKRDRIPSFTYYKKSRKMDKYDFIVDAVVKNLLLSKSDARGILKVLKQRFEKDRDFFFRFLCFIGTDIAVMKRFGFKFKKPEIRKTESLEKWFQ